MSTQRKTILIVDAATSGYHETKDVIMEIACILVDARGLEVIDVASTVIHHEAAALDGAPDFHKQLVDECVLSEHSLKATEGFLLAGPWSTASAVCNRALDFDLKFLKLHMPTFERSLPRLRIELKGLEIAMRGKGVPEFKSSVPRTYRACDDAVAAYEELKHWVQS